MILPHVLVSIWVLQMFLLGALLVQFSLIFQVLLSVFVITLQTLLLVGIDIALDEFRLMVLFLLSATCCGVLGFGWFLDMSVFKVRG